MCFSLDRDGNSVMNLSLRGQFAKILGTQKRVDQRGMLCQKKWRLICKTINIGFASDGITYIWLKKCVMADSLKNTFAKQCSNPWWELSLDVHSVEHH